MEETIVFDFDGVIHSYKSGWQGPSNIPDEPVEGIAGLMKILKERGYKIVVVSSRARTPEGVLAITQYLDEHEITYDEIDSQKPPAKCYIDDRGIRFNGSIEDLFMQIEMNQVWNKPKAT